jgi:hypothetical protein
MAHRINRVLRSLLGGVALALVALPVPTQAQNTDAQPSKAAPAKSTKAWTLSRTVDGQPDLQGTWVNFDDTPFESTGPGRRPSDVNPPEHWTDHDSPTSKTRRSMVVEPADGLVPLLKSAEEKRDFNLARIGDSWEYETSWVRCITRGVPGGFFPAQYNNAYQIVQVPGYVVIRSEMIHDARIIPIDGRPRVGAAIRQWNGDSRGHWDGDTLVVETANFNDKGMIATSAASGRVRGVGQSDALRVVERFRRTGEKTIEYEARIEDPKTYSKPWKVAFPFNLDNSYEIYEYSCHEGNYAMVNELTTGRKHDAEAAKSPATPSK